MKVIVAGSRSITDKQTVYSAIKDSGFDVSEVVSGNANGVDKLGEQWAVEHGIKVTVFKPQWNLFGKQAGSVRNTEMARYADALIAVWDGKSNGTRDMIRKASMLNLLIYKEII